jgi:hypothetical protein
MKPQNQPKKPCDLGFYNRITGRSPFSSRGTFTSASPSSTTCRPTLHTQVRRAGFFRHQLGHGDHHRNGVADLHRRAEIERLRNVDRAGPREPRAEHRRDQARGVEAMRDAPAELRARGKMLGQMHGIAVAGGLAPLERDAGATAERRLSWCFLARGSPAGSTGNLNGEQRRR